VLIVVADDAEAVELVVLLRCWLLLPVDDRLLFDVLELFDCVPLLGCM
jgi:hypothetical protein